MTQVAVAKYDYEAYLAVEKEPGNKYEYHNGMITAMAGGTPEHGMITMNIGRALGNALEKEPCSVLSSDVKVRIEVSNRTFYPDVSVVCGEIQKSERDVNAIINPKLIVEVLSESTASFDLGEKFAHYRKLTSLEQYIIISQESPLVHTYYRTQDGTWEIQTFAEAKEKIELKSIRATIEMADIYRRVSGIDPSVPTEA
ncbi:MAG: Uma2 family endonuclease [Bacteroidota bacterium]